MTKSRLNRRVSVCVLSAHPLVFGELDRLLDSDEFRVVSKRLDLAFVHELRQMVLPLAKVYVVDAHTTRPAAASLISNILRQHPASRVLVVQEKFSPQDSYSFLRLGVKGLLTYTETKDQLAKALAMTAKGGFWVPRKVLSGFVEAVLSDSRGNSLRIKSAVSLSRREQEVLDCLLENLANKEIASKLNISERTVKFHVSNLLSKFGVQRRADLILLCYQGRSFPSLGT